jgi:Flp pilus assembly protein TadD
MTPDYASPEQLRGDPLTQATDVYSLGVVLYRLLTGKQPQVGAEETAPPPSSVVSDTKLRAALSGDLDTIIGMAMRKEPERRYASAAEFEADIHCSLSGRPVKARPDTMGYRAKRWVRKHGMQAAAMAAVVIFGFAAALQWRLREEEKAPEEALALCQRADTLLRGDVRASQPGQGLPAPLREAIALYTKATEVAPEYVPAWNGLANAAEFTIDYDSSRSGELQRLAERAARQALRLNPRSAAGHAVLGSLLLREWKFNEAAAYFGKAANLDPAQPYVLSDYADCLTLAGRREEAARAIERNLRGREGLQTYGPSVRASVILLSALAGHYRELGKVELALETSRKAIRLQGDYGPARLQYGTSLERRGDLKGAEREYLAAHTMRPGDGRMIASLGHLYARQRRRAETQQMLDSLDALRKEGVAVDSALALVYAGMGDEQRTLDALEAAVRAHEPGAPQVFLDRRLTAVLETPRALALARQIGVTPVR